MKITAVIVARKGSRRIPNKMHQIIDGQSLIQRKVRQCLEVKSFDQVIVGSDDESIKEQVEDMGARFVRRPDRYCDEDAVTPNLMVKNMLSYFKSDVVVWAHPTNPFIEAFHYESALSIYKNIIDTVGERDVSVTNVAELRGHFYYEYGSGINHLPNAHHIDVRNVHRTAAQLPAILKQTGGIFIRDYGRMAWDGYFLSSMPSFYITDEVTGWDIDEPWQLEAARDFLKNQKKGVKDHE